MSPEPVTDAQRFSRRNDRLCPVCGGGSDDPQGEGRRCYGFMSGSTARCTREEYAKGIPLNEDTGTYAHVLNRECRCGTRHPAPSWWQPRLTPFKYTENGLVIGVHMRRDWPDGKKDPMWWEGLNGRRLETLQLYNMVALDGLDIPEVILTEGEGKCDALVARGFAAVGTATGAGSTHLADAFKPLLGRRVYLWPDNDDVGREHMKMNAARLREIGHQDVRLVNWTDAPPGGDAADFTGSNEALTTLLDQAVPVGSTPTVSWTWATVLRGAAITATRVVEPDALVKGLFTRNLQHAIIGASGSMKTWVEFDLCVCVACPEIRTFLGQPVMVHGPVVIESWEQGQSEDLRRLQKLLRGYGRSVAPETLILASEPALTLNDDGAYQARLRDFTDAGVVLYAFDSLSEGCGIELNDNTAYTAWWRARVAPMLKAGITVVFTHLRGHITGKPGALADRDAVFRGATQIRALTQAAIECRQITEASSLLKHNKHRDTPALPLGTLNLVGGFEDPTIRLSLVAPLGKDAVRTAEMRKLLWWLQERPGSSKTKIKNGLGMGQTKVYGLLDEAARKGWITALEGEKGEVWSTAPDWRVRSESGAVDSDEESDG